MDISPKMLTQTLGKLEVDGLLQHKSHHEVPPKVEYCLTEIGCELIPCIARLKEWSDKQIAKIEELRMSLRRPVNLLPIDLLLGRLCKVLNIFTLLLIIRRKAVFS